MSKSQVLELLMSKNTPKLLVNEKNFQSLVNGVFQAEDHWGGYFTCIHSVHFLAEHPP